LALLLAALVAGCSGEGLPSLSLPTSHRAQSASLPGGMTADTPGNPFSEARPPSAVARIANLSLGEVLKTGELGCARPPTRR
jgi:hypothetical protein